MKATMGNINVEMSADKAKKLRKYVFWALKNDTRPDYDDINEEDGSNAANEFVEALDLLLGEK